jgi:hypothetical protein
VDVRRFEIILAVLLASGALAASAGVEVDLRQSFPLNPGTEWVYSGFVRWFDFNADRPATTHVTWTMSVVREYDRGGIRAAVVKGFPADLNWTEGNAKPELWIVAETRDGKFYLNTDYTYRRVLDQLDNKDFSLEQLLNADGWILQLPLEQGKRFCDATFMDRDDGKYCWLTGPPHAPKLSHVAGITPAKRTAFDVEYDSIPEDAGFEFVDGVGITSYGYHHHGSLADTEVHLVEFHPPETAAAR